ncbi:MAG: WGR domain-containing protein [Pseudomonadota bacterium]
MYDLDSWSKTRWVSETRYYEVVVHQDLFGKWVTTRINGGINSALGQTHHVPAESLEAARARAVGLEKRRKQRGYVQTA